ncbi:MAG: iron-containing alcohol dehydrogenase [Promethearchaeota archaeon]
MTLIKKMLRMSRFYFNPEVYYRNGAVSCLKEIPLNNLLILLSNTIKNSKYYNDTIKSYLDEKTIREEIIASPTQETVSNIIEKYSSSKPDAIVAIGGGKVIDTAKCIKLMLNNPDIDFTNVHKIQYSGGNEIKLVAIPTTPSTGSEANGSSVITNNNGFKIPYTNDTIVPDIAVLDPTFLESFDIETLYVFAADIFTHASEGMVSIGRNPLIQALGQSCLSLLESGFKALKEDPKNTRALSEIMGAGYLGGIIVGNAGAGAIHALAHTLEKQLSKSHSSLILSLIKPVFEWLKTQKDNPFYDLFLEKYDTIGFENHINREFFNDIDIDEWIEDSPKDMNMMFNSIKMDKDNVPQLINWVLNNK